ncbi:MAG TPA: HlyD family efflux transporter periplasmic adaptor subunit [Vicinamibacterales bacterium]|jgi:HlyD family secretion protein|nr:HlyD family efflux transporter periplasmic adaptor subunit [Vicinamibacterales bacterium]
MRAILMLTVLAAGCARAPEPDAYGNVEATEVVVGAEGSGQLISFTVEEGNKLAADATVGEIDRTQLELQRAEASAQRSATAARVAEVQQQMEALVAQREAAVAQRAALVAQHEIAKRAYERTSRLYAQQAATAPQLDQAERDLRTLGEQVKSQDRQIAAQSQQIEAARAQQVTVRRQVDAADAQIEQIGDRIRKTAVVNPVAGTVLATYAKAGEFVQQGQPLYKIADLDAVEVRAYVDETQLASVRLGQGVQVTVDTMKDERKSLPGTVSWVSSEAEFTPTPIQTREERAELVYAIKIRVANQDGVLKIGMPVDVNFSSTGTSGTPGTSGTAPK